jgi:methylisocitrate lyase
MLFAKKPASEKRKAFKLALGSGKLQRFPGAYSPLAAMLIEQKGFEGVYISGAVLANDLGLPDIGLTTLSEVAGRGRQIARVTELPAMIDIDTGFGESLNAARTLQELEEMGLAGCHMEDQIMVKRCGHLDNKTLVSRDEMVEKIRTAIVARRDPNFILCARTDARGVEGLEAAIERAKAYVAAGADMVFPEGLKDPEEFKKFRAAIQAPLLANMTEFGKSKLLTTAELTQLGYNLVIYPVTGQRLAMKALEDGLDVIRDKGTQESIVERMQTRKRLYEILHYEQYNTFDSSIFNFKVNEKGTS